jgi:serine/threonine protein kinase
VYRALDRTRSKLPLANQYVALKVFHPSAVASADALANLRTEFHCAQSLSHPHIVNVLELNQDGPLIFMTMELLDGETLEALLARRRAQPLPQAMALAIIRDVGAALAYAHERGVVHGDVQPRHIMITEHGAVRVIDFAAARTASDNASPETNAYASCEALEGQFADRRDDLYSLACVSFELLSGHHPFNGLSAAQARGRALLPRRPKLVRSGPWQALRAGLAWRRENRTVGVSWWLARMGLGRAAERLPTLQQLAALPAPRRRRLRRPQLLAASLGATIATAAMLGRLPSVQTVSQGWSELRATTLANPLRRLGDWLSPAASTLPSADRKSATTRLKPVVVATSGSRRGRISNPASAVTKASAPVISVPTEGVLTSNIEEPGATAAPAPEVRSTPDLPMSLELTADSYTVLPGEPAARIEVRRHGNLRGDVSFLWSTESASALPERDFIASGPRAEQMPAGVSSVTLLVPIVGDATRKDSRVFYVTIAEPGGGAELGANSRAAVLLAGGG